MTVKQQPIDKVEWVDREELTANTYNPNKVFPPELRLLKLSILKSGWTQPIVIREDMEIVDGYHRWLVSDDAEVRALTGSKVPCVYLRDIDPAEQRMATIRHNRARGKHAVMSMADIINSLVDEHGMDRDEVGHLLQMETEEVKRLHDRGDMLKRHGGDEMGKGWKPQ